VYPNEPGVHKPAVLRERFETSLRLLNKSAVRVFYLHAPDRSVPFEETLGECDKLHKEGKLCVFGTVAAISLRSLRQ
jgi:aflatoxin B1 aldehyde reductase